MNEAERDITPVVGKKRALRRVFNVQDDYHTPQMLVTCLFLFIEGYVCAHNDNKKLVIYCPFDTEDSEYVRVFRRWGHTVIFGDITTGQDFFETEIPVCDIVISNPPFSKKLAVFKKLFDAGIPFAILMNMQAIQYQEIGKLFYDEGTKTPESNHVQFIIPDKKVSFNGNTSSFCSGYVCWNFVKRTHYVHLPHNNTGKHFIPAYGLKRDI